MSLAHPARPFGLHGLLDSPDDGYRHEIIDEALMANPAPALRHQRLAASLLVALKASVEAVRAQGTAEMVTDNPYPVRVTPGEL